ncbi:MAG: hypothetical protein CMK03_04540 [Ponticaulis sp.]|nr:hypothetical protein [Ponticaulis sp.]
MFSDKFKDDEMLLFLLWWLVDDHLAEALNAPGLGELPIWVPLIISLAFSWTFSSKIRGRHG